MCFVTFVYFRLGLDTMLTAQPDSSCYLGILRAVIKNQIQQLVGYFLSLD